MLCRCRLLFLALILALSGSIGLAKEEDASTVRPHILFVVMDDLGSHDLGMHKTGIATPCADRLAADGVYLDNYYVLPSCSPTRSALLTGRYPLHTGIHNWLLSRSNIGLPLDEEVLPQVLGRANYRRHAVGKWHLGHSRWEFTPTFRGFESFYGFYVGGQDYFTHVDDDEGYDMRYDRQPNCGPGCSELRDERGNYTTHIFTREAIRVIQQHHNENEEEPLFLYLAFQAVHAPDQVPESYRQAYENRTDWSDMRKTYAGMLTAADEGIANVTQALKDNGLWDNTLVIFTTDNGGPTETCAIQGSSNFPRRGGKCTVWEGGTTGDGFVSGPALSKLGVETGKRHNGLFHCVDWLPTLANMVGAVPQGKPLDGVDQLAALQQKRAARQELFIGIGIDLDGSYYGPALRYGRWKIIENGGGPSLIPENTSQYYLFDILADRTEVNNLAEEKPFVLDWMKQKLKDYKSEMVPIPPEDPDCPFDGLVNTSLGLTWIPWCTDDPKEVVMYW